MHCWSHSEMLRQENQNQICQSLNEAAKLHNCSNEEVSVMFSLLIQKTKQ